MVRACCVMVWLLFLCPTQCGAQDVPCLAPSDLGQGISRDPKFEKTITRVKIRVPNDQGKQEEIEVAAREGAYGAAAVLPKLWNPGQTLVIQFKDGAEDKVLLQKVQYSARLWERYTNLRFIFLSPGKSPKDFDREFADIRISFEKNGHYSLVGTDSTKHLLDKNSMNLELTGESDDAVVRRVVLHEFGHALGFIHEHQNPSGGIKWKMPASMEYYKRRTGWTEDQINQNIFNKVKEATGTAFDKDSIMLYPIPPGLTEDGFSVGWNDRLSRTDVTAATALYPATQLAKKIGAVVRTSPGYLRDGALIVRIEQNSILTRLREFGTNRKYYLEEGDIIQEINGKSVQTSLDCSALMSEALEKGRLVLKCWDSRQRKHTTSAYLFGN